MSSPKSDLDYSDRALGSAIAGDRGVEVAEPSFGGVELSRFLEAYPLPWSCECNRNAERPRGMDRSYVNAADGTGVISGTNNAKAEFITHRVNCHDDLLEQVRLLEKTVEYSIRRSRAAGDDEGARLSTFTLYLVRETIARAEGRAALAKARAA